MRSVCLGLLFALVGGVLPLAAQEGDPERDILVTFDNQGARATGSVAGAPYRNRKRYTIAATARRDSDGVRKDYALVEVDHWPIRSLSIYCFVYRVPEGEDRNAVIERLRADTRVESVQPLQEFETSAAAATGYDDAYANLQHGLSVLDIGAAHRISRGKGVRIAIVDSDADSRHEDLRGRLAKIDVLTGRSEPTDAEHGTAVASIIGARANNAVGIVGIAPEATLQLYVSCWADPDAGNAVCDSFTLARAVDLLLEDPPDILNMSLTGPYDPLLARLLAAAHDAGVLMVAARAAGDAAGRRFPAVLDAVIGVGDSGLQTGDAAPGHEELFAPGQQIIVAIPDNAYDFRSGSSLAAAHVSGTIALLLAVSPDLAHPSVLSLLRRSQQTHDAAGLSVNACIVLQLDDPSRSCRGLIPRETD